MPSVTAVPGPMDGAGTTGQQPGDHATTPCHTQAGCRGLRAWTLVTTHSRRCDDANGQQARASNQLRRHWLSTDRHQSESFQGLANQWQGGTCHRKFRADEWRLPRVSPRQLPQRNRKDLDRAHKCTGAQVRRAKIPTVRRDTTQSAATARCAIGSGHSPPLPDWMVRRGLPPTRGASESAKPDGKPGF